MKVDSNINQTAVKNKEVSKYKSILSENLGKSSKASTFKSAKNGYDVEISKESQKVKDQFEKSLKIALATSDIREDRVAKIKAKIDKGEYSIDTGKIADGLIKEAIYEQMSLNTTK